MDNPLLLYSDSDILEYELKNIFNRVTGLEMTRITRYPSDPKDLYSFVITTHGDYEMSIIMYADIRLLRIMTQRMKHGEEPDDEEIPVYVSEFYNILCGHIVSRINRENHCSSRFSIPKAVKGQYVTTRTERHAKDFFYQCEFGYIRIEVLLY